MSLLVTGSSAFPIGPAGGDLGATYPSPVVVGLTGTAGTIAIHGNGLLWDRGSTASIGQQDPIADVTPSDLVIEAQAGFGGAAVNQTSGHVYIGTKTGALNGGNVNFRTSSTIRCFISDASFNLVTPIAQFGAGQLNPFFGQQADGSGVIGDTLTIGAQDSPGAGGVGGVLRMTSGAGPNGHGLTNLQCGGLTALQLVPTNNAVNFVSIKAAVTGQGPTIRTLESTDANVTMTFLSKGTGIFLFKPGGDGINAFQVQASAGTKVLSVDTTNQRVGIGGSAAATPFSPLSVEGARSGAGVFICDMNNTTGGVTNNSVLEIQGGNNTGVASSELISFLRTDSTQIGRIIQNAATTVQYATSSDGRIKENVSDSERGLDILMGVRVRDFNFTNDETRRRMQGFIAQELFGLYPEAVTPGGDDPSRHPWSVDYGRMTPLLVRAIQELSEKLEHHLEASRA